jgi:hypothetical protein
MQKLCSCCSQPAQYSWNCLLSSVGISARIQQCSRAVLFCNDCLRVLCECEFWGTDELREAVNNVYTALNSYSKEK